MSETTPGDQPDETAASEPVEQEDMGNESETAEDVAERAEGHS